ncbi:MAG: surface lipoprotein assembly modifier [Novosphingobium sp.]
METKFALTLARSGLALALLAAMPVPALADQPGDAGGLQSDERSEPATVSTSAHPGQSLALSPQGKNDDRLKIEVGVLPRYVSNYFEAQDEFNIGAPTTPAQSVSIVTVSGSVSYNLVQEERKRLNAAVRVRHNIFTDLDSANSTDVDVSLTYDARPSVIRVGYFGTRHRLVSNPGLAPVYGKTDGLSADYLHRLTKRLRGQIGYRYTRTAYPVFPDRNLSEHLFSGELRYQVQRYFMPAIGVEYSRGNAALDSRSFKRKAVYLSVTSEIGDRVYLSLRYRHSKRDYLTVVPTDSYFGREDPRNDISGYGTVQLGGGFSLFGYFYHASNRSNQLSHRFKSDEAGLGLFYRF